MSDLEYDELGNIISKPISTVINISPQYTMKPLIKQLPRPLLLPKIDLSYFQLYNTSNRTINLIILGDKGVGKTSFYNFINSMHNRTYEHGNPIKSKYENIRGTQKIYGSSIITEYKYSLKINIYDTPYNILSYYTIYNSDNRNSDGNDIDSNDDNNRDNNDNHEHINITANNHTNITTTTNNITKNSITKNNIMNIEVLQNRICIDNTTIVYIHSANKPLNISSIKILKKLKDYKILLIINKIDKYNKINKIIKNIKKYVERIVYCASFRDNIIYKYNIDEDNISFDKNIFLKDIISLKYNSNNNYDNKYDCNRNLNKDIHNNSYECNNKYISNHDYDCNITYNNNNYISKSNITSFILYKDHILMLVNIDINLYKYQYVCIEDNEYKIENILVIIGNRLYECDMLPMNTVGYIIFDRDLILNNVLYNGYKDKENVYKVELDEVCDGNRIRLLFPELNVCVGEYNDLVDNLYVGEYSYVSCGGNNFIVGRDILNLDYFFYLTGLEKSSLTVLNRRVVCRRMETESLLVEISENSSNILCIRDVEDINSVVYAFKYLTNKYNLCRGYFEIRRMDFEKDFDKIKYREYKPVMLLEIIVIKEYYNKITTFMKDRAKLLSDEREEEFVILKYSVDAISCLGIEIELYMVYQNINIYIELYKWVEI